MSSVALRELVQPREPDSSRKRSAVLVQLYSLLPEPEALISP